MKCHVDECQSFHAHKLLNWFASGRQFLVLFFFSKADLLQGMAECAWFFLSLIVTSSLFFLLAMLPHYSQQLCLGVTLQPSHLYSVDN